jgi:3-hydroxyacyl-[acyl-carrier-protein] dehydratase
MSEPAAAIAEPAEIDLDGIMARIPHRYPFLLIDKVVDVRPGESAVGVKNVTANEPFFQGHFPNKPVMPGVLIVEAMAQTAGVHVAVTLGPAAMGKLVYFMTIESARFRAPVVPGDQLRLEVRPLRSRLSVFKYEGRAMVDDRLVAEATYSAMLLDQ